MHYYEIQKTTINELFNNTGVQLQKTGAAYTYEFTTKDGQTYRIEIEPDTDPVMDWIKRKFGQQPTNTWVIRFGLMDAKKKSLDMGVTGTGGEFEVFGTVVSAVNGFIAQQHPKRLWFVGNKSDRHAGLYTKMMRLLGNKLGAQGYVTKSQDQGRSIIFSIDQTSGQTPIKRQ